MKRTLYTWAACAALLPACAASPGADAVPERVPVTLGVEVAVRDVPEALRGRRVGLITNHTGQDGAGTPTIDLLAGHPAIDLVALFAPEHGIRGTEEGRIAFEHDERTGLPVHSLYGETRRPTAEMLAEVDVLVFDIQDVGARQYTYFSTMALALQAAAEAGLPFVVLDRPNPIGGAVEGNLLDPRFASFVGLYPVASRHGLTAGEFARLVNAEFGIGAELTVVPLEGWHRDLWLDATNLEWVRPSPNLPTLSSAMHYPGTVFFEGTNVAEGRGSELPFEQVGAPWLRAEEVAAAMNALGLAGVRFEPVTFDVRAGARKFPGETLAGVRLIAEDRARYEPVRAALLLIDAIRRLHPEEFQWRGGGDGALYTLDRLIGTDRVRLAIEAGGLPELLESWRADEASFRELRQRYLLY
jgi:uncharacterized protein YbbC (DUF1343 family)